MPKRELNRNSETDRLDFQAGVVLRGTSRKLSILDTYKPNASAYF